MTITPEIFTAVVAVVFGTQAFTASRVHGRIARDAEAAARRQMDLREVYRQDDDP